MISIATGRYSDIWIAPPNMVFLLLLQWYMNSTSKHYFLLLLQWLLQWNCSDCFARHKSTVLLCRFRSESEEPDPPQGPRWCTQLVMATVSEGTTSVRIIQWVLDFSFFISHVVQYGWTITDPIVLNWWSIKQLQTNFFNRQRSFFKWMK